MRPSRLSFIPISIFALISLILVFIWFKEGLYFGGAEVGLSPYYNPVRFLEIIKFIWWNEIAPGMLVPQFINAIPVYFILSLLQNLFSPLGLQMILFFTLLFLMGWGMYLFSFSILGRQKKYYALIAGLFYMFNSYMMVEVWHRFLYTGFFLAAALPILALLWKKWIGKGSFFILILFLLTSLFFSYMYGNLTSIITLWIVCLFLGSAEAFFPWQGRNNFLKIVLRFIVGFLFFLLTNLWWLLPVIKVSTTVLPEQHNIEDNVGTLVSISKQTILPFTLQFANPYYLFYSQELGKVYSSLIFQILPWLPSAVIFMGLLTALKNKTLAPIGIFYFLAILLAKGAATPFGYPYIWGFMNIFIVGVIRNPFEKLGILLPFFGSILFVLGIDKLFIFFGKKFGIGFSRCIIFLIIISVFIFSFPMFTDTIFNKPDYRLTVEVPDDYKQADKWLKNQKDPSGNILHLPFSNKDVVTYNWENGYHGVGVNEILFTSQPSITRNIGIKRIDNTLEVLKYIFTPPYAEDKKQILRILQNFNVKYIVLHKDIVWKDRDTYGEKNDLFEPSSIENVLDNLDFLKKEQVFGQLNLYKLDDKYYKGTIFTTGNTQLIYPGETDIMKILSVADKDQNMITPVLVKNNLLETTQTIVFPDKKITYLESSPSAIVSKINDILNPIPQMRNFFYSIGYLQSTDLTDKLINATQEILAIYQQSFTNKIPPSNEELLAYELMMKKIFEKYSKELSVHILFDNQVRNLLGLHRFILRELGQGTIQVMLENFMTKMELLPSYGVEESNEEISRQVFKFKIPLNGIYQILSIPKSEIEDMKINGEKITTDKLEIKKGDIEISIKVLNGDFSKDIALKLKGGQTSSNSAILNFKKDNSVKYTGKIKIDKPTFVFFQQTYNPNWILNLYDKNKQIEIKQHFMGDLYSNAYFIDQVGEYNFKLEFEGQKYVKQGVIVSAVAGFGVLLLLLYSTIRRKT